VPIKETMDLLGLHFEEDISRLFHDALTTSYCSFNCQFYGQIDGVAMGSLLSPDIANFYMEDFEKMVLDSAPQQPLCWFRYMDDTFIIWPHGDDKLQDFLNHLNSIHQCIQFTMETEREGHLPFLDTHIYRRPNSSLGHRAYVNPPIRISISMLGPTTSHPPNKLYFPHWCIGLELFAMKTTCMWSWCS
jgi:hypothetical protein